MSDDLVKRLRDVAEATGPNDARQIALDAADRIEELEAKLDWVITERDETFALMLDRVQTAEAKLAKAVKLMELSVELATWNTTLLEDVIDFITELKGERDA